MSSYFFGHTVEWPLLAGRSIFVVAAQALLNCGKAYDRELTPEKAPPAQVKNIDIFSFSKLAIGKIWTKVNQPLLPLFSVVCVDQLKVSVKYLNMLLGSKMVKGTLKTLFTAWNTSTPWLAAELLPSQHLH